MTYEDVKRIRNNPTSEDVDNEELQTLIDLAIEKQIPKKEIKKTATYDGEQHDYGVCPICFVQGRFAGTMTANYCYNCGQAIIDWSEKE